MVAAEAASLAGRASPSGLVLQGTLYAARLRPHESAILDTTSTTLQIQEAWRWLTER